MPMTGGPWDHVRPSSTIPGRPVEERAEALFGPAAHCIHRNPVPPDDIGNLVAIHADDVPEHEHRALMWCQLSHCSREVRIGVETRGEVRFDADLWNLGGQMLGTARAAPQFVEAGEANAPKEPRPQGAAVALDRRSGLDEFEKRLLHRVLGESGIVNHPVGE
jgi:hypothetical protein